MYQSNLLADLFGGAPAEDPYDLLNLSILRPLATYPICYILGPFAWELRLCVQSTSERRVSRGSEWQGYN